MQGQLAVHGSLEMMQDQWVSELHHEDRLEHFLHLSEWEARLYVASDLGGCRWRVYLVVPMLVL